MFLIEPNVFFLFLYYMVLVINEEEKKNKEKGFGGIFGLVMVNF